MSDYLKSDGKRLKTQMVMHTLQRHYDILQDYYHEYEKTKSNIAAFKEREDLLGSIERSIRSFDFPVFRKIYYNFQLL